MNILILGGGGREHALAWAISQNPDCTRLFCAPGNAGIADVATCVALNPDDGESIVAFCRAERIDLVVVGPEAPLVSGIADVLRGADIATFGPSESAAALEASKSFTKDVCDACGAPTAAWSKFTDPVEAKAHIDSVGAPIVVKADGLAAGKGVVVAETVKMAHDAIDDMFSGAFGSSGYSVVIEEFMAGEEASYFVLTDGKTILPLASAQDHKRAFDGDTGPNTGGMGAYSPAPVVTDALETEVLDTIVRPILDEMSRRGTPYQGVLYAGLMIDEKGPRLVEINVRFGDPEAQVLMARLGGGILPALYACAKGTLDQVSLDWAPGHALTVVMAANGYPGAYEKNSEIRGLDATRSIEGVTVFHAGTRRDENGRLLANGGRVMNVTATAPTLAEAKTRAYAAIDVIDWPDGFNRSDIGWRALKAH